MTIDSLKTDLDKLAEQAAVHPDSRIRYVAKILIALSAAICERNERALCDVVMTFARNQVLRIRAGRN